MHKKIFEPVLSALDGEQAVYFSNIANKLDEDPRAQQVPNLVFLMLKDTAPFVPSYLPPNVFIDELLAFIKTHQRDLSNLIYSREFIEDPSAIRKISSKFVGRVLELILEKYDEGEVGEDEQTVHTVSWPYTEVDFPYAEDED